MYMNPVVDVHVRFQLAEFDKLRLGSIILQFDFQNDRTNPATDVTGLNLAPPLRTTLSLMISQKHR